MTKQKIIGIAFRWIIFFSMFLCIGLFIEPMFAGGKINEIRRHILYDIIFSKEDNYDVYFIGASHTFESIYPALIDQVLPTQSGSLILSGSDVRNSYFQLKKAVNAGKAPKVVVYDSYGFTINTPISFGSIGLYNRLLIIKDAIQFSPPEDHFANSSVLFLNHAAWMNSKEFSGVWKRYNKYFLHKPDKTEFDTMLKNYSVYSSTENIKTASMVQYNQEDILPAKPFNEYNEYQLLRLTTFCRSHGIKLIIIDIPTLNSSRIQIDAIEEFASVNGISFYKFDSIFRDYFDNRSVFYNGGGLNSHMNRNGAILFDSYYIGPMLAEEMGWKYDREAADKLTQLVQVGLDVKGLYDPTIDKITFTMTPLNLDLQLEYDWVLKKNNSEVIQDQKGGDNSFTVQKTYLGIKEFQIEVHVSSPEITDEVLVFEIPLS